MSIVTIVGSTETRTVNRPARIKSVLLTTYAGAGQVVITPVDNLGPFSELSMGSPSYGSYQYHFDGVLFPNGFTITPVSTVKCYVVEYEVIVPDGG